MNKSSASNPSQWYWVNLNPAATLAAGFFTNIGDVQRRIRQEMGISDAIPA